MNRKEFLKKASLASSVLSGLSVTGVLANTPVNRITQTVTALQDIAIVSDELNGKFLELIGILRTNGWADFLNTNLGVNLSLTGDALKAELIKNIDSGNTQRLKDLKSKKDGFDDFAGVQLINPGYPALSLLYHALASPRVKPANVKVNQYPCIAQLDTLENYIYALKKWEDYKNKDSYNITSNNDLVLAVFAYEYRPAHKTPHHAQADMVYSRTGIARIGNQPINYDSINRSHTNKPNASDDPTGKSIAVTPARYALFLAKVVKKAEISVTTSMKYKGDSADGKSSGYSDKYDDRADDNRYFLLPVRKVFNDDLLFGNGTLKFRESHTNEKLSNLVLSQKVAVKRSGELVVTDGKQTVIGSSFLIISLKNDLIRRLNGVTYHVDNDSDNRYFTTYSKKENIYIEVDQYDGSRIPNSYTTARNQPMYIHIAHQLKSDGTLIPIIKEANNSYEEKINIGNYDVPVFEDNICDGIVSADITALKNNDFVDLLKKEVMPAFSIVTAPDFFPYVDLFDIAAFDVPPGESTESNFYEGGVASLATSRIRPNPKLINPVNNTSAFPFVSNDERLGNTFTAVIAHKQGDKKNWTGDYDFNSYLPDVCSAVFAPGWDVTYASKVNDNEHAPLFLTTQGLGSPFVEDMKLCAAMNGMWAVASPDTARVFQGTVTTRQTSWYANPTAIPLMDDELGFHQDSPANEQSKKQFRLGWDGEQGPFLQYYNNYWSVNFTDLGRADYVENALNKSIGFDMSSLRELRSKEIFSRMSALKKSIKGINSNDMVALTHLWLVSAEKYKNGSFEGNGIPKTLFGKDKSWATGNILKPGSTENYYLFVFANALPDKNLDRRQWAESGSNVKRRRQACQDLYVCHVSDSLLKICKVISGYKVTTSISWYS